MDPQSGETAPPQHDPKVAYAQPAYAQPAPAVYASSAVDPSPPSKAGGAPSDRVRFDYASGYRDPFFLGLFIVHLIIMVALTGAYGQKVVDLFNAVPSGPAASGRSSWVNVLLPMVIVCACVAVAFSFFWIWCMKRWGGAMIYFSFFIMIGLLVVNIIYGFGIGASGYSVWCIFVAAFMLLYLYAVRNRIPFTKAIMSASSHALQDFPASVWISYCFSTLQVGWFAFWVFAIIAIIVGTASLTGLGIFFMLLSFYWTSQVIRNISHTTTAGMVGSWWLQPNQPSPTLAAFKRATTTSLGSIALGSLIVAAIQALNGTLRAVCRCGCYSCIHGYIERILKYFNMYTFSYVAIYGQPFVPSAKCTMALFSKQGFTAVVNDSLVGAVLFIGSLIGGGISALVALAWVTGEAARGVGYYSPDLAGPGSGVWLFLYLFCAFYAGVAMTSMSMTVFQSAVATTFVVWADDAPALAQHRPAQYKALADGAVAMYGAAGAPAGITGGSSAYTQMAVVQHPSSGGGQPAVAYSNPQYAPQTQAYHQPAPQPHQAYAQPPPAYAPAVHVNVQIGAPPPPTPI